MELVIYGNVLFNALLPDQFLGFIRIRWRIVRHGERRQVEMEDRESDVATVLVRAPDVFCDLLCRLCELVSLFCV